jgi:transposase
MEHQPRETQTRAPKQSTCPKCGGTLRKLSEDLPEILEFVPAQFEVIRIVRAKLSCTCCAHIVQASDGRSYRNPSGVPLRPEGTPLAAASAFIVLYPPDSLGTI